MEAQRKQGIALDCFGIGWEDYNDDLLEQLSSHGDGRYAFLNSPEDAAKDFAAKLAGALQIAAADVKVQVEFNPDRVIAYRQIGYAKHQLTKEQFRDNTVAAGEIAAQEAGNALYTIETNPAGDGPVATVHVRYRIPGTSDYREQSWDVPYTGSAPALEQTSAAMRLAAVAAAFSEWLAASPYAPGSHARCPAQPAERRAGSLRRGQPPQTTRNHDTRSPQPRRKMSATAMNLAARDIGKTLGAFLPLRVGGVCGADGERAGVRCSFHHLRAYFAYSANVGTSIALSNRAARAIAQDAGSVSPSPRRRSLRSRWGEGRGEVLVPPSSGSFRGFRT